jgi:cytosine/uracil/thiamine/allantoin permease
VLPHLTNWLPAWWGIYGWFFGVIIGGVLYFFLCRLPAMKHPYVNVAFSVGRSEVDPLKDQGEEVA